MQGENGEFSLLDFISYYESGPVLKERTPDVIRTPSHPEELVFDYADDQETPGKTLTRRKKNQEIHKKALGLIDVPGGSPPGAQGYRPRSTYEQQDFEVSHRTGFGGPSIIDVQEDKHPSNISRWDKRKPINNSFKTESENFFSFLETGRLKRRRVPKLGENMNTEQRELIKLAEALKKSGYDSQSNIITKLAMGAMIPGTVAEEAGTWVAETVAGGLQTATEWWYGNDDITRLAYSLGQGPGSNLTKANVIAHVTAGNWDTLYDALATKIANDDYVASFLGGSGQGDAIAQAAVKEALLKKKGLTIDAEFITKLMWKFDSYAGRGMWNTFADYDAFHEHLASEVSRYATAWVSLVNLENGVGKGVKEVHEFPEGTIKARPVSTTTPAETASTDGTPDKSWSGDLWATPEYSGVCAQRTHTGCRDKCFFPADTSADGPVHKIQKALGFTGPALDGLFGTNTYAEWKNKDLGECVPKDIQKAVDKAIPPTPEDLPKGEKSAPAEEPQALSPVSDDLLKAYLQYDGETDPEWTNRAEFLKTVVVTRAAATKEEVATVFADADKKGKAAAAYREDKKIVTNIDTIIREWFSNQFTSQQEAAHQASVSDQNNYFILPKEDGKPHSVGSIWVRKIGGPGEPGEITYVDRIEEAEDGSGKFFMKKIEERVKNKALKGEPDHLTIAEVRKLKRIIGTDRYAQDYVNKMEGHRKARTWGARGKARTRGAAALETAADEALRAAHAKALEGREQATLPDWARPPAAEAYDQLSDRQASRRRSRLKRTEFRKQSRMNRGL